MSSRYSLFIDVSSIDKLVCILCYEHKDGSKVAEVTKQQYKMNYLHNTDFVRIILNMIDELEGKFKTHISSANLIAPDSYFVFKKLKILHQMPFETKIDSTEEYKLNKDAWGMFKKKYPNESLFDLRSPFIDEERSQYSSSYSKDRVFGSYLLTSINTKIFDIVDNIEAMSNLKIERIIPNSMSVVYGMNKINNIKTAFINAGYSDSNIILIDNNEIDKVITMENFGIIDLVNEIQKNFNLDEQKSFNLLRIYLSNHGSIDFVDDEFQNIQKSKLNMLILTKLENIMRKISSEIGQYYSIKDIGRVVIDGMLGEFEYTRSVGRNVFNSNIILTNLDKNLDINNAYAIEHNRYVNNIKKMSAHGKKFTNVVYSTLRSLVIKINDVI